jgi:hypothetical protein
MVMSGREVFKGGSVIVGAIGGTQIGRDTCNDCAMIHGGESIRNDGAPALFSGKQNNAELSRS